MIEYDYFEYDTVDSTTTEAIKLIEQRKSGNFVVWAKTQTAARGTHQRVWQALRGNIGASIVVELEVCNNQRCELSLVISLAVYDLLNDLADRNNVSLDLSIKWPNDLLISGKKVAGILVKTITFGDKIYLIAGIGINVNVTPQGIDRPITSLFEEISTKFDIKEVLNILIKYFNQYFIRWSTEGFANARKLWLKRAYKLNEVITVNDGNKDITGVFREISKQGHIVLETIDGELINLISAEFIS